jgi:cytochrome c biogenesis protein CcmG/thiol:disulfide interchange protein DsbE
VADTNSRRRTQSIGLLIVAAVLVVIGVLLFVPLGSTEQDGDSVTVGGHPLYGKPAPEIDLISLDGERVSLSSLQGRPVLVNFWATWCMPCREEFPLMVDAYAEHADAGLEILGVIHADTDDGARAFSKDLGAEWPMLADPDDAAWNAYTGVAMPTSFFVDPDGIVRAFSLGGFTEAGLTAQLGTILVEAEASLPAA